MMTFENVTIEEIKNLKAKEIKELAKSCGIKNWWTKKKDELITELEELKEAGDEAAKLVKEEDEREKAAVAEYTKNYRKYTARYNVDEFLKKWRAGEIVLDSELDDIAKDIEDMIEHESEKDEIDRVLGEMEETTPDLGKIMKGWSAEKKEAYDTHLYEDFVDTSDLDIVAEDAAAWSEEYDKAHAPKEEEPDLTRFAPREPKRGQLIEYNGKSQNICAWAKELGISPNTLYGRLYKLRWPIEKALSRKKK